MGGLVSRRRTTTIPVMCVQQKPAVPHVHVSSYSYGDHINVEIVYGALFKLSCLFEIDESLTRSLSDEILDLKHVDFNEQFVAVEAWIQKHCADSKSRLTSQEIDYLIQYVELYRPTEKSQANTTEKCSLYALYTESEMTDSEPRSPLICPYRHEIPSLTGDIRSREAKKLNPHWHSPVAKDNTAAVDNTVTTRFSVRSCSSNSMHISLGDSYEAHEEEGRGQDFLGGYNLKTVKSLDERDW